MTNGWETCSGYRAFSDDYILNEVTFTAFESAVENYHCLVHKDGLSNEMISSLTSLGFKYEDGTKTWEEWGSLLEKEQDRKLQI